MNTIFFTEILETLGGHLLSRQAEIQARSQKLQKELEHRDGVFHVKETYSPNPDFTEIHFKVTAILDNEESGMGVTLAKWSYDHMEFYFGGWTPEMKNWVNFIYVLNHEVMHGVIGKILLEDGLEEGDCHFPFIAGMDDILGFCTAHTSPHMFMDIGCFFEEAIAFGNPNGHRIRQLWHDTGLDLW